MCSMSDKESNPLGVLLVNLGTPDAPTASAIRRYLADTYPTEGEIIATLDDKLCRFLTVGDVDGDGTLEMVAAAAEAGLWLLRPKNGRWSRPSRTPACSSGSPEAAPKASTLA